MNVWKPLPSLIFGVFGTVSGALAILLPETLGEKLQETVEEAEAYTGTGKGYNKLINITCFCLHNSYTILHL